MLLKLLHQKCVNCDIESKSTRSKNKQLWKLHLGSYQTINKTNSKLTTNKNMTSSSEMSGANHSLVLLRVLQRFDTGYAVRNQVLGGR